MIRLLFSALNFVSFCGETVKMSLYPSLEDLKVDKVIQVCQSTFNFPFKLKVKVVRFPFEKKLSYSC